MICVIIPASGVGTRFGGDKPKQFLPMQNGLSVLENTLAVFEGLEWIHEIVVTVPAGLCPALRPQGVTCVEGGASRSESVYKALLRLSPQTEIVLIHDGVRPLVGAGLIEKVADAARKYGAAVAGTVFTDTVKEADATGRVRATPERGRFWQVQTPQGFTYKTLLQAYEETPNLAAFTDDSAILEARGGTVFLVEGARRNIKITTAEDLCIANALLGVHK
ncbi:MAG: 2-C-methyl-D-erythritol 4-phosphate cytidylyltransferase [Defluviitaleaceae bacterium]|nr:2-C-methyl-D-erythritol 4-phosphate cytidylyltransferase [Defluviitaleaceae bacterium]MCL2239470.1 2-C-methyl-D-erythritol 4-phosphate cytidylyltransferase [Defluviitaleaceae bacterium]